MKAEGVKSGVFDLMLPLARGGSLGLWLEMKRARDGRVSEEQKAWRDRMLRAGYAVAIAYGFEEARRILLAYLAGVPTARTNEAGRDLSERQGKKSRKEA